MKYENKYENLKNNFDKFPAKCQSYELFKQKLYESIILNKIDIIEDNISEENQIFLNYLSEIDLDFFNYVIKNLINCNLDNLIVIDENEATLCLSNYFKFDIYCNRNRIEIKLCSKNNEIRPNKSKIRQSNYQYVSENVVTFTETKGSSSFDFRTKGNIRYNDFFDIDMAGYNQILKNLVSSYIKQELIDGKTDDNSYLNLLFYKALMKKDEFRKAVADAMIVSYLELFDIDYEDIEKIDNIVFKEYVKLVKKCKSNIERFGDYAEYI